MLQRLADALTAIGLHGNRHLSRREFIGGSFTIGGYICTTGAVAADDLYHTYYVNYDREQHKISIPISKSLLERFRNRPFRNYYDSSQTSKPFHAHFADPMDTQVLDAVWKSLDGILEKTGKTGRMHDAKIAASFVCSLEENPIWDGYLYSTEILAAEKATPFDKALLYASLMHLRGLKTGFYFYDGDPHIFPGIDIRDDGRFEPVDTTFMAPDGHLIGLRKPPPKNTFLKLELESIIDHADDVYATPLVVDNEQGYRVKGHVVNIGNVTSLPTVHVGTILAVPESNPALLSPFAKFERRTILNEKKIPIPPLPVDGSFEISYDIMTQRIQAIEFEKGVFVANPPLQLFADKRKDLSQDKA